MNCHGRTLVRLALDFQRASAQGLQTVSDVCNPNMRTILCPQLFLGGTCTVIGNGDEKIVLVFSGTNGQRTAVFLLHQSVTDGIFRNRLQRQRRHGKMNGRNLVDNMQLIPEPLLLQIQICLGVFQLLLKGNGVFIGQRRHIGAQKAGKGADGFHRLFGIGFTELADSGEHIV